MAVTYLIRWSGPNGIFWVRRVRGEVSEGLAVVEPGLFDLLRRVRVVDGCVPVGLFEDSGKSNQKKRVTWGLATMVGTPNEGGDVHGIGFVRDVSIGIEIPDLVVLFSFVGSPKVDEREPLRLLPSSPTPE
jgi:hypothetical protein